MILAHRTRLERTRRKNSPALALLMFLAFLGVSAFLVGCASRPKIENVMLSFTVVKKVVTNNLPQGLREESPNGRELTSGYFNPKNWEDDASERSERAFAKVIILGSSRPFNIDVRVIKERKTKNSGYSGLGEDRKLTKDLVERLREALADRREERNIIDDFRPF